MCFELRTETKIVVRGDLAKGKMYGKIDGDAVGDLRGGELNSSPKGGNRDTSHEFDRKRAWTSQKTSAQLPPFTDGTRRFLSTISRLGGGIEGGKASI